MHKLFQGTSCIRLYPIPRKEEVPDNKESGSVEESLYLISDAADGDVLGDVAVRQ